MWLQILTIVLFVSFLIPISKDMIFIIRRTYKRKRWEKDVAGDAYLKQRTKRGNPSFSLAYCADVPDLFFKTISLSPAD